MKFNIFLLCVKNWRPMSYKMAPNNGA